MANKIFKRELDPYDEVKSSPYTLLPVLAFIDLTLVGLISTVGLKNEHTSSKC